MGAHGRLRRRDSGALYGVFHQPRATGAQQPHPSSLRADCYDAAPAWHRDGSRLWRGALNASLSCIPHRGGCLVCTVSWTHQPGGYHLLCNRDEKRTRGAARAPELRLIGGTRCISPADSDFGGTWIAVNEWGLTLCLLNGPGD